MRVRSPSATLTLTTTVSPGWKSGIFAPGNLAACSASSFSMMFISDSCRDAGFLRAGERFGALFSVEARLIEQRPARVERYCRGPSLPDRGTSGSLSPMPALRLVAFAVFALFAAAALAEAAAPSPAVIQALAAPQALPDVVEGRADALATIIEYASLTCSHCAAFHKDAWPAIKAKYVDAGKAKFILREFPLDPLSVGAFMLARCAGAKREAVIDRLFDHQSEWAFTA